MCEYADDLIEAAMDSTMKNDSPAGRGGISDEASRTDCSARQLETDPQSESQSRPMHHDLPVSERPHFTHLPASVLPGITKPADLATAHHRWSGSRGKENCSDGDSEKPSSPVASGSGTRQGSHGKSTNDAQRDDVACSVNSSISAMTEQFDLSSSLSALSSQATTPPEFEDSQPQQRAAAAAAAAAAADDDDDASRHIVPKPCSRIHERLRFNVRPRSSIPTHIAIHQYAAECIDAAESSRLNPFALHPEEYDILRHHITHAQVTTYLNVRNGILRIWLQNPSIGVTRQEAVGCASTRWFDAANVCYDWLIRRGYINYGCVRLDPTSVRSGVSSGDRKRRTVAVIGAGVSGLACARQLEGLFLQYEDRFAEMGEDLPRVVIVEGRGRVGGRVYSREFKSKLPDSQSRGFQGQRHTAEMGGMIITGFDRGNPVNILVRGQLGLPYHALTADTTIYDSGGRPVDPVRDQLVEKLFNDCLDRVSEHKHKPQPSKSIEGNRALLEEGRDHPAEGGKTIMQAEEATAALPDALPVAEQNVPQKVNLVPVSADKLTGRVHNQPGVAASEKVAEKAKAMGWELRPEVAMDFDLRLDDAVSRANSTLGSVLDHALTRYQSLVDLNEQDHRLINWHVANLEYSNATSLHDLSLSLWDMDAGNEWEGKHTMVVGGYQSLARGLLHCPHSLNLTTKFTVKTIKYHDAGFDGPALVESEDGGVVEADNVVCTVPLGVLKHGDIEFEPALPAWKLGAVERLGFGVLNKVVLVYNEVFWDSDRHIFGVLRDPPNPQSTSQEDYGLNRGRFFQWFNVTNTTGLPCLLALMAGEAGFETERASDESLVDEATQILRSVFGSKVPLPIETIITRWGSDRFARGSYSSAAPGMQPDDYDNMARSVGNLSFAGEHTCGTHPATVHGAYLSGLRAACEILEGMIGPIDVPSPLLLSRDSALLQKRKLTTKDPGQSRIESYETEMRDHVRGEIGHRPLRPIKVAVNALLLYSRVHTDVARKQAEENRKKGSLRSMSKETRAVLSKMWKAATPEQRRPFEEQAAAEKGAFQDALDLFNQEARRWDQRAAEIRAQYEKDNPRTLEVAVEEQSTPNRTRRTKQMRRSEDDHAHL